MNAKIGGVVFLFACFSTSCCHHAVPSSKTDFYEITSLMDQAESLRRDVRSLRNTNDTCPSDYNFLKVRYRAEVHGLLVEKSDLLKSFQKRQQYWRQSFRDDPFQFSQNPQPEELLAHPLPPLYFNDVPLGTVGAIINDELKRICPKSCPLRLSVSEQISSLPFSAVLFGGAPIRVMIEMITSNTKTSWSIVGNTIEIKSIEPPPAN
jgi:hypothetical protein